MLLFQCFQRLFSAHYTSLWIDCGEKTPGKKTKQNKLTGTFASIYTPKSFLT